MTEKQISNNGSRIESKNRIGYLDALRLIATLAVVMLHTGSGCMEANLLLGMDVLANDFYRHLCNLGVPVFVMISGSLFLVPEKDTSYTILFKKYVRRIALALLVFGLPMCILEMVMTKGNIMEAIPNFLTGHSWTHMWYLYMLIGLYLLTPIIKPMLHTASEKTVGMALIVLFVMSSVLPSIDNYGIALEGWMKLPPFIFLYILGYYMSHVERWRITALHCILALIVYVAIIGMKELRGIDFAEAHTGYFELNTMLGAAALFMLAKRMDWNSVFAKKMNPYLFAVYLIHPVFLNVSYKMLKVNPNTVGNPWLWCVLFAMVVFLLSLACSYILKKIPVLRKYVL